MSDDAPGPLIASGRAADVYDLGDGTVLRRYRGAGGPTGGVEHEARVMNYVASQGVRVPEVVRAEGTDLVMERIDGATMIDELQATPWKLWSMGRLLARLQAQLAGVRAPRWLLPPGWDDDPSTECVLHLDLHPMNVIITTDEPVIIDWTNAAAGPAGFDAAISYVEMATFETDDTKEQIARTVMAGSFRHHRGRRLIAPFLAAACDHRLADRNVTPGERVNIAALRKRAVGRST